MTILRSVLTAWKERLVVGLSKQQKKDLFAMLSQIKKQLEVEIASDGEKKNRKGKGKIMHVLKTLLAQVKEFTRDSILTPIFMLVEVAMEMVIPLLMASIIDEGVNKGRYAPYLCHRCLHDLSSPRWTLGWYDGRKIRSKGVCRICQKPA